MVWRKRIAQDFDASQPLVATQPYTLSGVETGRGDPVPEDTAPDLRLRLWMSAMADYAQDFRPTPEGGTAPQNPNPAPDVIVTATGSGWYTVQPNWLPADKAERIQGQAKAGARATELLAQGPEGGVVIQENLVADLPDFSGLDDDPTLWTDEQRLAFTEWHTSLPAGAAVNLNHTGAARALAILVDGGSLSGT